MLRFDGSGVSDRGPVREVNEDAGFLGANVLVVTDGVGGSAAGEVASATTRCSRSTVPCAASSTCSLPQRPRTTSVAGSRRR